MFPELVNEDWERWKNHQAKKGIGCFMHEHGDYYRKFYKEKIRPEADKILKNGTMEQKMAYRFQWKDEGLWKISILGGCI